MSAESANSRRSAKAVGQVVRPQAVSDRSYMESVVGFIHEVVPQAYSGSAKQDDKETVIWVKFQSTDINDFILYSESQHSGNSPPLLLVLGYVNGVQVWTIPANGEAQEVLSWRQGPVRAVKFLPNPVPIKEADTYANKRPLIAICDGPSSGQPQHSVVSIVSLRSGDQVHSIRTGSEVLELHCNKRVLVITFQERIAVYNLCTFREVCNIKGCFPCRSPAGNPIALGSCWLAFADTKLMPVHQTCGGMVSDGSQSYTATVIHAAKTITKGLTLFGETVASSLTGQRSGYHQSSSNRQLHKQDSLQPGIVTVVDFMEVGPGEVNLTEDLEIKGLVAHFPAHSGEPLQAMAFDPSGLLLLTASSLGQNFHIFNILPHPSSSTLAAVHHLYTLHRGDTTAKVQDIAFSLDSRWVAVTTHRGTTHIFPITPYGGPITVRTHMTPKVVNRYSRFQKSAGLEDIQQSTPTGRNSPVPSGSPVTTSSLSSRCFESHPSLPYHTTIVGRMGNARLPPYPVPTTLNPLSQLKQPLYVPSSIKNSTTTKSPPSKGQNIGSSGTGASASLSSESISVASVFSPSRAWLVSSPSLNREKREKRLVESLFVINSYGTMIEYTLDPKPSVAVGSKGTEDSPIDLVVVAHAQWNLSRSLHSNDIKPPLPVSNPLLQSSDLLKEIEASPLGMLNFPCLETSQKADDEPESWLSQVEIITHAGPHRRLWMGPQFCFKAMPWSTSSTHGQVHHTIQGATVVTSSSPALLPHSEELSGPSSLDLLSDDLPLNSLSIRPARSSPVAMPAGSHSSSSSSASGHPLLIEASSGSFEQMVTTGLEGYSGIIECGSLVNAPSIAPIRDREVLEDHLKETLADAMIESPCKTANEHQRASQTLS